MKNNFDLTPNPDELHELDQLESDISFEQEMIIHYQEMLRDKRSAKEVECPTWAGGCQCQDMIVGHLQPQGKPWCPRCQKAHDGPIHAVITQAQFLNRFKGEKSWD